MHSAASLQPTARRACGACGSDSPRIVHKQSFVVPAGYPLPAEYVVVGCSRCGFVYADPAATQHDYDRFYSDWSKYDDAATATGSAVSPFDAARLKQTAADIARALPSKAATILDAGCATGGLLTALQEFGFSGVSGLDPSARCAEACRDRGFEAYVGSIGAAPAHMPKFDCLVLSHVLEHVYDIPAFFTAARRLLAPGGYLYIETPDASQYSRYMYAPLQEFNTEHINHFSRTALANTAQRYGFRPVLLEQKVFPTSKSTEYPAVFGVFQDIGHANADRCTRDDQIATQIETYIHRSNQLMRSIEANLARQIAPGTQLIVWGAGQLSMKLLTLPVLQKSTIVQFVDNNPVLRGKRLAGAPIVAPSAIAVSKAPIVIATLLHTDAIVADIRRHGIQNPVLQLLSPADAEVLTK